MTSAIFILRELRKRIAVKIVQARKNNPSAGCTTEPRALRIPSEGARITPNAIKKRDSRQDAHPSATRRNNKSGKNATKDDGREGKCPQGQRQRSSGTYCRFGMFGTGCELSH